MNFELNHLKYFHAVARERSFTRASRVLRVQQPTISKMVRNLEQQLGVELLIRQSSGAELTPAGLVAFRACEQIFDRVNDIRLANETARTELEGPLAFGATDSVCSYLIPS